MKRVLKLLFLFTICVTALSCSTNYYTVLLSEDAKMYTSTDSIDLITTVPKNTEVFLSSGSNKKKYKRIKWGNYSGWTYNPAFTTYSNYVSSKGSSSGTSAYHYSSGRSTSSSGSVSVKGHYRKNGSYVRPHTRSAPSRRK